MIPEAFWNYYNKYLDVHITDNGWREVDPQVCHVENRDIDSVLLICII
jgi:hypothetical protein